MNNKKIVIVNKVRFMMFLIFITVLLAFILSNVLSVVFADSNIQKEYNEFFVKEGDSIWNIAENNNPNREDIRKIVYEIKEANNIKNEWLKPGDVIKIPRN